MIHLYREFIVCLYFFFGPCSGKSMIGAMCNLREYEFCLMPARLSQNEMLQVNV